MEQRSSPPAPKGRHWVTAAAVWAPSVSGGRPSGGGTGVRASSIDEHGTAPPGVLARVDYLEIVDIHYDVKPLAIRATRGNSGQISAKFLRDGTVQRVGLQWIADSAPFGTKSLQFSESATCPHRAPGTRDQGRSKRDRGPSTRQKNVI